MGIKYTCLRILVIFGVVLLLSACENTARTTHATLTEIVDCRLDDRTVTFLVWKAKLQVRTGGFRHHPLREVVRSEIYYVRFRLGSTTAPSPVSPEICARICDAQGDIVDKFLISGNPHNVLRISSDFAYVYEFDSKNWTKLTTSVRGGSLVDRPYGPYDRSRTRVLVNGVHAVTREGLVFEHAFASFGGDKDPPISCAFLLNSGRTLIYQPGCSGDHAFAHDSDGSEHVLLLPFKGMMKGADQVNGELIVALADSKNTHLWNTRSGAVATYSSGPFQAWDPDSQTFVAYEVSSVHAVGTPEVVLCDFRNSNQESYNLSFPDVLRNWRDIE